VKGKGRETAARIIQTGRCFKKGKTGLSIRDHELRFRQWLAEHTGLLLKVVRSFAEGSDDQDDLFQEILLQVWLSLPNFRDDSKPTTWLYKVALNTALAWKRGEKKRWRGQGTISISDVTVPSVGSAEAERNDRIVEQLYAAVRALPPAKRALVVLYLDGFTYREIAEVMGISESNVGVSLNRIKKELAAIVKDDEDDQDSE
jgi:RNA polymerase sigma-70 factor (ECF subfamily)